MAHFLRTLGLASLVLSLPGGVGGCAHKAESSRYHVVVNSFARENALEYRTYVLMPYDSDVEPTDLEFQEYAAHVNKVLGARGFRPVRSIDDAEAVVLLEYGIGEPRESSYTYSRPIWGQTGVASTRTTTSTTLLRNSANLDSQTSYTPQYGITGYTTQTESSTSFTRHVLICAIDAAKLRNGQKDVEIWRTKIVSIGSGDDLRRIFPAMLAAARDLLAKSTGRMVKRTIPDDAPSVLWLRRVTSPKSNKAQQNLRPNP